MILKGVTSMKPFLLVSTIILLFCGAAIAQTQPPAPVSADCAEAAVIKKSLDSAQARLRDWPNLIRYRKADSELAAPAAEENRVVFMGDSITDIWNQPDMG